MISATKPVLSVCAVRTGCGKSQAVRYLLGLLEERSVKAVGIRHPMPYGNLLAQAVHGAIDGECGDSARTKASRQMRDRRLIAVAGSTMAA